MVQSDKCTEVTPTSETERAWHVGDVRERLALAVFLLWELKEEASHKVSTLFRRFVVSGHLPLPLHPSPNAHPPPPEIDPQCERREIGYGSDVLPAYVGSECSAHLESLHHRGVCVPGLL